MADKLAVLQVEETVKELERLEKELVPLIKNFHSLSDAINVVSGGFSKGTPKEYTEALSKMESLTKQLAKTQQEIINLEARLAQIKANLTKATLEEARATEVVAKAEERRAKTKAIEQQMSIREERERDRRVKLMEREQAKLAASESIYARVEARLKSLQAEYKNLATMKDLGAKMSDKEIQKMTELEAKIKKYDTTLKSVDATMGKYQRNVGNYASGFNPLANSINQLTREAPAFAHSVQTGFLAISNNLPIFFDAITQAKEKTAQLRAEGQKVPSVFSQLTSSLFSWNTALSVGVTLLTLYGKDMWELVKKMVSGKDTIVDMSKVMKDLNDAKKEGAKSAGNEIAQLNLLYDTATNVNLTYQQRYKAVQNLQKQYPSYFGNLTTEQIMVGQAVNQYKRLKDAIIQSARARAMEKRLETKESERQEALEGLEQGERQWQKTIKYYQDNGLKEEAEAAKKAVKNIQDRKRNINKQYDDAANLIAGEIAKNQNNNTAQYEADKVKEVRGGGTRKSTTPKGSSISSAKKDAIDHLKAERDNELASLKERKISGEIAETEYWEGRIKVIDNYTQKVQNLLNKSNAKENKLAAETRKKAVDELEKSLKEIYEYKAKELEAKQKEALNPLQEKKKSIETNSHLSETEKVSQLLEINAQEKKITDQHYKDLIMMANTYGQNSIDIAQKANEEALKNETEHLKLLKDLKNAVLTDIEKDSQLAQTMQTLSYEKQKQVILADKTLSASDRELKLKLLDLENQKKINQEKIKELKLIETELLLRGNLTREEEQKLFSTRAEIRKLENENTTITTQGSQLEADDIAKKLEPIRNIIADKFKDLGLGVIADQFSVVFDNVLKLSDKTFTNIKDRQKAIREIIGAGLQVIADFGSKALTAEKEKRIAEIDEEIKKNEEQTDLEISFINKRLEAYANMENLTQEQIAERNALEDEARVLKDQQLEREKQLHAQKVLAEQKAQAQQALIDGASGAVKSIAHYGFTPIGIGAAMASIAFGALQSMMIQSKNPVPQYFVGRKGGPAEIAFTQERGAELITDKHGNIKTLGTNQGATLTALAEGDRVYTATETKNILKTLPEVPTIGDNLYQRMAMKNITPIIAMNEPIDYDKLAQKIGEQNERITRKYDKPVIYEENGIIYKQEGGRVPIAIDRARKNNNIIRITNERN